MRGRSLRNAGSTLFIAAWQQGRTVAYPVIGRYKTTIVRRAMAVSQWLRTSSQSAWVLQNYNSTQTSKSSLTVSLIQYRQNSLKTAPRSKVYSTTAPPRTNSLSRELHNVQRRFASRHHRSNHSRHLTIRHWPVIALATAPASACISYV